MSTLLLRVVDGVNGYDLAVTATAETTLAELVASLPIAIGQRPLFLGHHLLFDPAQRDGETTVGGSALRSGDVLTVGTAGPSTPSVPGDAVGVLRVYDGPDVGRWCWVRSGHPTVIGRANSCPLPLSNPKTSRQHATFLPQPAQPGQPSSSGQVCDLGSTNHTFVQGQAQREPATIADGHSFTIGDAPIMWTKLHRVSHAWGRQPDGQVHFTRRFHHTPLPNITPIALPEPPAESPRNLVLLLTGLGAPLLMGLVSFTTTGQPAFLAMTLLSPVMMLLMMGVERRTHRRQQRKYRQEQQLSARCVELALAEQQRARRLNHPDSLGLHLAALGALPGLWSTQLGSPDALSVRVGVGDQPSPLTLTGTTWKELPTLLQSVPITVDLRQIGVLGVAGDAPTREGLVRWLLVQLAARRCPSDLQLVVLAQNPAEHLHWLRWLPHVQASEQGEGQCRIGNTASSRQEWEKYLADLVAGREQALRQHGSSLASGQHPFDSDVVVLLEGAGRLRTSAAVNTVLTRGPAVGVYSLCVDEVDINECRGTLTLQPAAGAHPAQVQVVGGLNEPMFTARAEDVTNEYALTMARLLAPLRDSAQGNVTGTSIPYPVRYLDLCDIEVPTVEDVLARWQGSRTCTSAVPLGADANGTVTVDVVAQGPHAMLGGTTGAGKSYLLQTLLASLLLHNRPDQLNVLLVDFKGGAAFLPFAEFTTPDEAHAAGRRFRCPHVVGLIRSTDDDPAQSFDQAAADRVLASIRAEVSRRERILARYGGEIERYHSECPPSAPPLPRLVMVFDEFARVLDTSPGFIPQLVAVAGKGRSLGMHLMLATQSLQGKLTPELKNNVDLRISLRQNQREDSLEILDTPDAASIPGRLRGRGFVVARKDDPPVARPFQTGHLGAPPPSPDAPRVRTRLVAWRSIGHAAPTVAAPTAGRATDQDLLLAAIEQASTQVGGAAAYRPLLPPLPSQLSLSAAYANTVAGLGEPAAPGSNTQPGLVGFGLQDVPELQAQPLLSLDLDNDQRMIIGGGAKSGRTTALRAILHQAVRQLDPDHLHVYIVAAQPSGWQGYAELPHCGGVFTPSHPERIRALIAWLHAVVSSRVASPGSARTQARVLLLIDGWEHFHDPSDPMQMETGLVRQLREIIAQGSTHGVHVVITCGRAPLVGKPADVCNRRFMLRFDQPDVGRLLLPSGCAQPAPVPGRAVELGVAVHAQIALPEESADQLAQQWAGFAAASSPARRFPALPTRVSPQHLHPSIACGSGWVGLGVSLPEPEADAAPWGEHDRLPAFGVDLFAGPSSVVVSGSARSGRSNIALLAAQRFSSLSLKGGVGVLVLCTPRSPLVAAAADLPGVAVLPGPTLTDVQVREAAASLGRERTVIVVDDCHQVSVVPTVESYSEQPTLLHEAMSPDQQGRMAVVLCGDAQPLVESRRSLSFAVLRAFEEGTRVLIGQTSPNVARLLQFPLEPDQLQMMGVGRGFAATGRTICPVQFAQAE